MIYFITAVNNYMLFYVPVVWVWLLIVYSADVRIDATHSMLDSNRDPNFIDYL